MLVNWIRAMEIEWTINLIIITLSLECWTLIIGYWLLDSIYWLLTDITAYSNLPGFRNLVGLGISKMIPSL